VAGRLPLRWRYYFAPTHFTARFHAGFFCGANEYGLAETIRAHVMGVGALSYSKQVVAQLVNRFCGVWLLR